MLSHTLLPAAVENTEQNLEKAIVSSYKENTQVVNQQMAA
jgi:bifunctional DNase/RNase